MTEVANDRLTSTGNEVTVTLHIYSDYPGAKEAKQAGNRIVLLLNQRASNLQVPNWAVNHIRLDYNQMVTESDGLRHLILRFRIKAQPIL